MDKTYDPKSFESKIYGKWTDKGYFSAKVNKDKKPFTIIMPPPNITGQLHMGHALGATIQDAITRYKRMQGYEALWLPGTDHASIATEVKIVDAIRDEGLTKEAVGREGFLKRAYEWNDKYGGRIITQFKSLGSSCDWDRLAFTMDEKRSRSVKAAFVKLFEKGYIYRGSRIINWCPDCRTAISDAEVEYTAHDSFLYHIKYPVSGSGEYLIVATTRPETMLGDTAVAVNPKDKRYAGLIGKALLLPLTNREIPVIADEYVEMGFGTGAVKITPAHDPNDYEVGKRHDLPFIRIMNDDATMNEHAGKYQGLARESARHAVVEDLKGLGLLEKTEKHQNNVGHCHRCDNAIEPIVSEQWFVRMDKLAAPAIEAVKDKSITFIPKRFEKMYMHWMANTKDWCISRQLWWGHRIPVFYCDSCGEMIVTEAENVKCNKCGGNMRQDEDVLDTWFSSALWPFSTLGWPDETEDLKYFYPTSVLETAYDIIGFWVSRMIFSGLEYMGEKPFDEVLIHGIVRDPLGRKMSKSLDNGVDPLEVIDKFGADTLRISLVSGVGAGRDIRYSADKQEGYRNFMNKIWNAARYVLTNTEKIKNIIPLDKAKLSIYDKWILGALNQTTIKVTKLMDKYEIGLAASTLYDFVWSKFCDWYIEFAKADLNSGNQVRIDSTASVLSHVMRDIVKLLHPIVPFITEEIYSFLPNKDSQDVIVAPYPKAETSRAYRKEVRLVEQVMDLIKSIRNLRAEMNIAPGIRPSIYLRTDNAKLINECAPIIAKLAYGKDVILTSETPVFKNAGLVTAAAEVFIPLDELVDFSKELERLGKELALADSELKRAEGKLKNKGFRDKAPASLIREEQDKISKYMEIKSKLEESIGRLKQ